MSDDTTNKNFRYSNDNRELDYGSYDYPSQQSIDPSAQKGGRHFYPNDNGGHYPNSNRLDISFVDPSPKKQSPNTNKLWTPRSIINEVKMWHDADDCNTLYSDISKTTLSQNDPNQTIALIEDKAGYKDLRQSDPLDQPSYSIMPNSNNKKVIDFDGDDHLASPAGFQTGENYSIFIVAEFITIDGVGDGLVSATGPTNSWQAIAGSGSSFRFRWVSSGANSSSKTFASSSQNGPSIYELIFNIDSSTLSVFIDGTSFGTTTYADLYGSGAFILFGNRARNQNPKGWVGENIMIDHAVNESYRNKIEGYLAHKWGLEQNLPSSHIYKKQTPTL